MANVKYTYKHIVIVHGIGDQAPNETALNFMNGLIRALPEGNRYSVEVHNLIESVDEIQKAKTVEEDPISKLTRVLLKKEDGTRETEDKQAAEPVRPRRSFCPAYIIFKDTNQKTNYVIGFSEVYWKHIPDDYIKNNSGLPIPLFTWAHSVNTRFLGKDKASLNEAREAIDNLEKMLRLIKMLGRIYKQSERFAFITERFLGDVQVYAESDDIRQQINDRFLNVMSRLGGFIDSARDRLKEDRDALPGFQEFDDREVYIVAHSEGTVVSYNCLVQGAIVAEGKGQHTEKGAAELFDGEDERVKQLGESAKAANWLPLVKALVTLGSPIDKHFTIWKNRFRRDSLRSDHSKISWFNYWDQSDPVGYGINVLFPKSRPEPSVMQKAIKYAKSFIEKQAEPSLDPVNKTDAERLFSVSDNDRGFTRYFVPGLAHVKYWDDPDILQDIIHRVMGLGDALDESPVTDRWWRTLQKPLAYLGYGLVRLATVFALAFFLSKLIAPLPAMLRDWLSSTSAPEVLCKLAGHILWLGTIKYAAYLLAPFALLALIEKLYIRHRGRIIYYLRNTLILLWVIWTLLMFTMGPAFLTAVDSPAIKDRVGYLTMVVVLSLVWKLHTTLHRGLFQMWNYTRGRNTEVTVYKKKRRWPPAWLAGKLFRLKHP